MDEERRELVESIESAAGDHVAELDGGECHACGNDNARAMLQGAEEHCRECQSYETMTRRMHSLVVCPIWHMLPLQKSQD